MNKAFRYGGQAVVYAGFAVLIGYFSDTPRYFPVPADQAEIKLGIAHGGKPKGECRQRTPEELAKLPPNMRKTTVCPRERSPVVVRLELNGELLYHESRPPTGLRGDGPSKIYARFTVPPGRHVIVARLRETNRAEGFDFEKRHEVDLAVGRSLAIDFKPRAGGFVFE